MSRLRTLVAALAEDFEQAVAAHDVHRPRGGQHTNGRCCEFGNVMPSTLTKFQWWARELRAALEEDAK